MNFKNIQKYPTYESYSKIQKLKQQQAEVAFKKVYKRIALFTGCLGKTWTYVIRRQIRILPQFLFF